MECVPNLFDYAYKVLLLVAVLRMAIWSLLLLTKFKSKSH